MEPPGAQITLQPRDWCEPREGSEAPRPGTGLVEGPVRTWGGGAAPLDNREARPRVPGPGVAAGLLPAPAPAFPSGSSLRSPRRAAGGSPGTWQTAPGALASCVRARGAGAGGWLGLAAWVLGSADLPSANRAARGGSPKDREESAEARPGRGAWRPASRGAVERRSARARDAPGFSV